MAQIPASSTNATLRTVIILLALLFGLFLPILHHSQNDSSAGDKIGRYHAVRMEDDPVREERLFDGGATRLAPGGEPAKPGNLVWTRHEDVGRRYHVLLTSQSSNYLNWQSLLMHYHYKKQKEAAGDEGDMGGFTRLVAASVGTDDISAFIPSKFVQEIDREKVKNEYKGYSVLNRPYSVKAFFDLGLHMELEEDYIFMTETDHIFMRPIPNLATVTTPVAYAFSYMKGMPKELLPMVRSVCPSIKSMRDIQPIGPSPSIIHKHVLDKLVPEWYRISIALKTHEKNYGDQLGWILEMYAFAISAACLRIKFKVLDEFQVDPTAETPCSHDDLRENYIFHYTYPLEFREDGRPMPPNQVGHWSLNKRNYGASYPPRSLAEPPKGAHDCAFYLTRAWVEAIVGQRQSAWKQAPVTLGTVGWRPKVLSPVERLKKGLDDLVGSR